MPALPRRMTKNQDRTTRLRPGKLNIDDDLDEDEEESSEEEVQEPAVVPKQASKPAPRASTFPSHKKQPTQALAESTPKQELDLEGFVTASESSDEEEGVEAGSDEEESSEESDEDSEEEESSSEDDKPRLIAPKFISKAQRAKLSAGQPVKTEQEIAEEEERRKQEKAKELLQAQIEKDQAARAAGKKAWDDEDAQDDVDDTDGIDPEAEHAEWRLREMKRIRRDREALVEREKELEEIERRRNLTAEEREAEDRDLLDQQKADQDGRGKMAYMQRYFHKGAFFQGDDQDEEVQAALTRDIAGAKFVDESSKEILPEYMRIRDMTKLGRKGRSKYKDLKSEDTGRWAQSGGHRSKNGDLDDRFQPDNQHDNVITGANAAPVGGRRQRDDEDTGRANNEKRPRYD